MTDHPSPLDRYHRQMLLPGIGEAGQRRLRAARVLIVGCGALGSVVADTLARAGVGGLRLVDRDVVEITNLQRQVLYDERDVEQSVPKSEAARHRLELINRQVHVEAHVDDFNHRNAERFVDGVDLIVDGLDNFEARYLLNDLAVARHLPYIYGGAVGTSGMSMPILPHPAHGRPRADAVLSWTAEQSTACLRCIFPEPPPPGTSPSCDTAGVLGPAVLMTAAHQSTQALKLLTGNLEALDRSLWSIDLWTNDVHRFQLDPARREDCPTCGRGRMEHLRGESAGAALSLCGRNAVQISAGDASARLDLDQVARRLGLHGRFTANQYLVRGRFDHERSAAGDPIELTLFPNGRAIIFGTTEPEQARSIYAKYVGM